MKTDNVDYGIYVDREKAFVLGFDHLVHDILRKDMTVKNAEETSQSKQITQQEHLQNRQNNRLRKYCRSIIANIENAGSIMVFGPSTSKFELYHELEENKRLKLAKKEVITTDIMEHHAAMHFAKDHFTTVAAGQQVFTGTRH